MLNESAAYIHDTRRQGDQLLLERKCTISTNC